MRASLALLALMAIVAAMVAPAPSASAHPCTHKDELWFRTADGTKLVGHRFGGKRPGARTAVILAHMSEGDLCVWATYSRGLARKGFFVFAFDFRGHGFSQGVQDHAAAAADVVAAVRAVRRLGARRVVVVGASLGGIAAIVAAPRISPRLHGVVSVSGPAEIAGQLNARRAAPRVRVPTLYLAAQADQSGPYDFAAEARDLYDVTGTPEKRVELVPGALHGTFLVAASARVRRLLEDFLRDPAGFVP